MVSIHFHRAVSGDGIRPRASTGAGLRARRGWRCLLACGAAAVVLAGAATGSAADEGETPAERHSLLQVLYRNRALERELARAERELGDGHMLEGLRLLQSVWDRQEDSFLWSAADQGLSSARRQADRLMRSLGGEGWKTYERMSGATARQLLADADAANETDGFAAVVRRYYFTAAGYEATDRLATRAFDRGETGRAAQLWRSLADDPAHRGRLGPTVVHKLLIAARLAGDVDAEQAGHTLWTERFANVGVPDLPDGLDRPERRQPFAAIGGEWWTALGNAAHNPSSASATPLLRPVWSQSWREGIGDSPIDLGKWEADQRGKLNPTAIANSALVVGDRVIFRDFDGVRAVSLETGHTVWRHSSSASLLRPLVGMPDGTVDGTTSAPDAAYSFAENTVTGTLSSDGERVYAIDLLDVTPPRLNPRTRGGFPNAFEADPRGRRTANYLVALAVRGSESGSQSRRQPVWRVGGPGTGEKAVRESLQGHFFLGPPLPVDERLFAVTESDRQLFLVALRAATGELLWTQGIGYVDRPIEIDHYRSSQACSPAFSEGIVVCTTQSGFAVGIDADTGALLWATPCGDDRGDSEFRRQRFQTSRAPLGHPGFASLPVIRGRRVLLLPYASPWIHCLDLRTGVPLWTADRRTQDGEFLAAVTETTVAVAGRRTFRGLSIKDGTERWSLAPGMPMGSGWRSGSRYHLPVQEGRVAVIDIERGQAVGLSFPQSPEGEESSDDPLARNFAGNLSAAGDWVVSTGPRGVAAFRTASWLLERSLADVRARPEDAAAGLRVAELLLLRGEFDRARTYLDGALGATLADEQRVRGERMLRELLYLDLKNGAARPEELLARLDRLSHAAEDRGRFLIQRAEFELERRQFESVLATAREFSRLDLHDALPHAGNPAHLVSAGSWVPTLIGRVQKQFRPDELERVNQRIAEQLTDAFASAGVDGLQQFLAVYGEWPQADGARLELAARLAGLGRFQQAELLLLECRESPRAETADRAGLALADLWVRLGMYQEAAALFTALRDRPAGDEAAARLAADAWLAGQPPRSLFRAALGQLEPVELRGRVRIREDRLALAAAELEDTFTGYRRRFLTPPECSFHLLDKGSATDSRVAVVDRDTGRVVGHIGLPARNSYPPSVRTAHVGHFFPLGSDSVAQGVSLLELADEKPLWTTTLARLSSKDIVRVGPAGPTFCVFQAKQYLAAVDPGTGRILWERLDVDPNSGLIIDPYSGMFGDREALVVFAADRMSYTVYRTLTGEEIRRGRLDVDISLVRRAFGRRLLFTSNGTPERRLILWDPLDDRHVFSEPAEERVLWTPLPDESEVVMVFPPNRLKILDVATGAVRLSRTLPDDELANISYIRAFRDRDRFYVNFQREIRQATGHQFSYYASDTFLSAMHLQGDLYVFDAVTGALEWKRTLPQRSVLQMPNHRLPFLIAVSRVRDRFNGSRQSMLVEAIDRRTGETLALKDNLFPDRLVVLHCDADRRRIELIGVKTVVGIEFGPEVPRAPSDEEGL